MMGIGWLRGLKQRQESRDRVEDMVMAKLSAAALDSRLASRAYAEARTVRVDRAAELRQTLTDLLRKLA